MCEWSVIRLKNGVKTIIMENTSLIEAVGDEVKIEGLFSGTETLKGRIVKIDSETHEILIG